MKIPDSESIFSENGNRIEFLRKGKTKYDIPSVFYRFSQSNILFRFFGKKHIYSDNGRTVFFKIIYDFCIICPLEILESSKSFIIRKGFIINGNDSDIFVGNIIFTISSKENIFYSEIRFLDENPGKTSDNRESLKT